LKAFANVLGLLLWLFAAAPSSAAPDIGTAAGWSMPDGGNGLDLIVLLNTRHPQFKRDLNDVTVIGEGQKVAVAQLGSYQVNLRLDFPGGVFHFPTVADILEKSLGGNYESFTNTQNYSSLQPAVNDALRRILNNKKIQCNPPTAMNWAPTPPRMALIYLLPRFAAEAIRNGNAGTLGQLSYMGLEQIKADQKDLSAGGFQQLGVIEVSTLTRYAADAKQANNERNAKMKQLQDQWVSRIEQAAQDGSELVAAIAPGLKAGGYKPEEVTICTTAVKDGTALNGLLASEGFSRWSGKKVPARVDSVLKTPEELFSAAQAGKCAIVVDYAPNLQRYIQALRREGKPIIVGSLMTRAEAQEPLAKSIGFGSWADLELARTLGSGNGASAPQLADLRKFGVDNKAAFDTAVGRMSQSGYDKAADPAASRLLQFLADEGDGRKAGQTALQYRTAANAKAAAERKAREEAEQRAREELAKQFPYEAVISCGTGSHINILACFAGGSRGVDTELKLTNGDQSGMYKAYNFNQSGGREEADGYHINLRKNFSLVAQNASDILILAVKVTDRQTGKVVYQNQAAHFGVISVRN
jgi:hypothetical protein